MGACCRAAVNQSTLKRPLMLAPSTPLDDSLSIADMGGRLLSELPSHYEETDEVCMLTTRQICLGTDRRTQCPESI